MIFRAFQLIITILFLLTSFSSYSSNNFINPNDTESSIECTPGESCDDGDPCTKWDKYDKWCNCSGTFQDKDYDGVCDAEDQCPDGDDHLDKNHNNIPDECEEKENVCSECEADENGDITICWIPTNKNNLKTLRGSCDYLFKFFDDKGNLKGKSQCGPCDCAMIGDKDTDGDGICDGVDDCPDGPNDSLCGCNDQDSDGDGICDKNDICQDHDDNEDIDNDGTPDGCDICPENPDFTTEVGPCGCDDQDSDGDGICDLEDCAPQNEFLPAAQGTSCNDGNDLTENDVIQEDGCTCAGTPIDNCEITAIIGDFACDDNGTPANADDDTYSFSLSASVIGEASGQWEGSYSNPFLGAFAIGPTAIGEKITIGPIPAGKFTATNVAPPIEIEGGLSIEIHVNSVGNINCSDSGIVDSPGTCECPDSDNDGVCDDDDICNGSDDNVDSDGDGTPDGCDECPENSDKTIPGTCGCEDQDTDEDGICDSEDCLPNNPNFPATSIITCDDGDPNTINDQYAIGSCECIGEIVICPDGDADGVCDGDDICQGHPDGIDTDGDGTPDGCDECPENADKTEAGDCGCDDQDSDGDGVCDAMDHCPGFDDFEDTDNDGTPDGCDECPDNGDKTESGECGCDEKDSDNDGICDEQDCLPNVPGLPSTFVIACDDGDPNTINDVYAIGSCECKGESIVCTDSDDDGVCDEDDKCEGFPDNEDRDNDGVPDACDCLPNSPGLPSSFVIACDDGDPNTINDIYAIGSCECKGEPVACPDSDNDEVCDVDDVCPGFDDRLDSDGDGTPDGCDQCPDDSDKITAGACGCDDCPVDPCEDRCTPSNAISEYEWIDKISINQLENETGDDGGYADYRTMSISLGQGDSVSFWMFPAFLEEVCEVSLHIYADWNQDCDFDDEDELIAWHRTNKENGADIAIPFHANEGDITIRFILHNGRIRNACQSYIDGEVEDYTINVFSRDLKEERVKVQRKSVIDSDEIKISPNPISNDGFLYIDNSSSTNKALNVRILNIDGEVIRNEKFTSEKYKMNLSDLPSGLYIVETFDGIRSDQHKIVVQD